MDRINCQKTRLGSDAAKTWTAQKETTWTHLRLLSQRTEPVLVYSTPPRLMRYCIFDSAVSFSTVMKIECSRQAFTDFIPNNRIAGILSGMANRLR